MVTTWDSQTGGANEKLLVATIGRDKVLNFASGQWIELSDDTRELLGLPGTLVRIVKAEGQTITIDSGTNQETAVVASISGGRGGRGGGFGGGRGPGVTSITVSAPLNIAHAVGAQVSGSGITLTAALTKAHENGAQVAGYIPTPGAANQYSRRSQ